MVRTLAPGAVHVHPATLADAVAMAAKYRFQGLDFDVRSLTPTSKDEFEAAGVKPIVFGLPVEWRRDEETWKAGLDALPAQAAAAQAVGCTRCATWVLPGSNDRGLEDNVVFHVKRFQPIAEILGAHGIALGLEYIGPKTLRDQFTHPFVYTQQGMLDVAQQIGPNVGLLVDCWHWYTSGGTLEEMHRLRPEQVVYVHVNDAPKGVERDAQVDNVRRLPGVTGVIDIAGFLGALRAIGYQGPVAAEPFDDSLKQLVNDAERLSTVQISMETVGL